MRALTVLAFALCLAWSLDISQGSRIVKRWAFFAKKDVFVTLSESKSTKKPAKKTKDDTKNVKKSHTSKPGSKTESKSSKKVEEKKTKVAKTSKKENVAKSKKADKHADKSKAKSKVAEKPKPKSKVSEKSVKKASNDKGKKKSDKPAAKDSKLSAEAAEKPKATLKEIPKNCDDIVEQYANGQLIMYEYKIKMNRCLKGLKDAERKNSITSKYDDDSSEAFFKHAMKYVNDEGSANYDEDEYEEKKSLVPATDAAMQNAIPAATDAAAANYYPNQAQQSFEQQPAQTYGQSQAAFTQNTMSSQATPEQQNYNYYARSGIPNLPQQQSQQDMSQQWGAPLMNTKKDTLPAAPAADDPFASFMNIQASSNAAPQATQQRSDIPAQANPAAPVDAAYQAPAAPVYQQAFFRDHVRAWSPEDHGMFPENP